MCDTTEQQQQLGHVGRPRGRRLLRAGRRPHRPGRPRRASIVGDAYYIVVQALNGVSTFRVRGYYPGVQLLDPTQERRQALSIPASASAWKTIIGAPYGGPFDVRPTSAGTLECRLEYPADAKARTLAVPPVGMTASFEQYLAAPDWDGYAIEDSDSRDLSHWDLLGLNAHADGLPAWTRAWYGLLDTVRVARGTTVAPGKTYHYDPVLWMTSANPALGPGAPPAVGLRAVGYKATLIVPQNLFINSRPARVRRGARLTLKGSLALPKSSAPDAVVAWAPGRRVSISRKIGTGPWRVVKRVTTGTRGAWSWRLAPRRTASFRAAWYGPWSAVASVGQAAGAPLTPVARGTRFTAGPFGCAVTAISTRGVTFTLLDGATFTSGARSVIVAAGASVTKAVHGGGSLVFAVQAGSIRRSAEVSIVKRIIVG